MKKEMPMRWFYILITAILMIFASHQPLSAALRTTEDAQKEASDWHAFNQSREKKPQAIFSDTSNTFRLCSSRPLRLLSSLFARSNSNQSLSQYLFTFKNRLTGHYAGLQSSSTHAIMLLPSSEYYVFRLRRLIC
ncbi:MAG: hypothetical protein SOZ07_01395 [Prevotella sp.]|nr:hypothetical protein [Prevotella sp.]MDY3935304.1 hypothetical protein [Prevotella sp.]